MTGKRPEGLDEQQHHALSHCRRAGIARLAKSGELTTGTPVPWLAPPRCCWHSGRAAPTNNSTDPMFSGLVKLFADDQYTSPRHRASNTFSTPPYCSKRYGLQQARYLTVPPAIHLPVFPDDA